MKAARLISVLLTTTLFLSISYSEQTTAHSETRLMRFPGISGDQVVFVYAGDLWTASVQGVWPAA